MYILIKVNEGISKSHKNRHMHGFDFSARLLNLACSTSLHNNTMKSRRIYKYTAVLLFVLIT